MPEPDTLAFLAPAPASSSRQRPADSAWVMSTVSVLKAIERERMPATVVKVPAPSLSTLRRRSLPFWADMGCTPTERRGTLLPLGRRWPKAGCGGLGRGEEAAPHQF